MHLSCDNLVTWSKHQKTHWMVAFTINTHLVNFGSHRPRRLGDISLFISHVTSWGHVTKGSSLPSVVAIRLLEVEIWPILIFNVRRRIHMIILLQSVTIQICRLFWHISYYKVRQSNFITKWQTVITKCVRYHKVWQTIIAKCVRYYKVRQLSQSQT